MLLESKEIICICQGLFMNYKKNPHTMAASKFQIPESIMIKIISTCCVSQNFPTKFCITFPVFQVCYGLPVKWRGQVYSSEGSTVSSTMEREDWSGCYGDKGMPFGDLS